MLKYKCDQILFNLYNMELHSLLHRITIIRIETWNLARTQSE